MVVGGNSEGIWAKVGGVEMGEELKKEIWRCVGRFWTLEKFVGG